MISPKKMKVFGSLLVLQLFFAGLVFPSESELYFQWINNTTFSEEAISKAIEQVESFSPEEPVKIEEIPPFHLRADTQQTEASEFCVQCHGTLPHRKDQRKRSFLNQHSRRIACGTCHFDTPDSFSGSVSYRWRVFPPAKSGKNTEAQEIAENDNGFLRDNTKIVPVVDEKALVVLKEDRALTKLIEPWEEGNLRTKAGIKLQIHQVIRKEGLGCVRCHTGESKDDFLDLDALGADNDRISGIRFNTIAQFFSGFTEKDQPIRLLDLLDISRDRR